MKPDRQSAILRYLFSHQTRFMSVLDRFKGSYRRIPNDLECQIIGDDDQIESLIMYTRQGSYYCSLKEHHIKSAADFIRKRLDGLFSIYGPLAVINPLLQIIGVQTLNSNVYYSMDLSKSEFKPQLDQPVNILVRQCSNCDFTCLKKLQHSYHLEEVYTDTASYPYKAEMKLFKKTLKSRINVAAFLKDDPGRAVAKANVNGVAPSYYQLGGIFTDPAWRGKGYASCCLNMLLGLLFKEKENVTLFVKKENRSAVSLYQHFNFTIREEMLLTYFS